MLKKPRSSKRKPSSEKRWAKIIIAIAATLLTVGVVWGGIFMHHWLFDQNDLFVIETITAETTGNLKPVWIEQRTNVILGDNLFSIDMKTVRKRLLESPNIRSVTLRRKLPNRFDVMVVEREPIAQICYKTSEGYRVAVDVDSVVLAPSMRSMQMPLISGVKKLKEPINKRPGTWVESASLTSALEVVELCNMETWGPYLKITHMDLSNPQFIEARLASGEKVYLPIAKRAKLKTQLKRLVSVLTELKQTGRTVREIDLTCEGGSVPTK